MTFVSRRLGGLSRARLALLSAATILFISLLDYLTGYEISFSIFYLFPIIGSAWYGSRLMGLLTAFAASLGWLGIDFISGHLYSHPLILYWNALVRLGFFILVTYLLCEVKERLDVERRLAMTDFLTGALNSRAFYDLLSRESDRLGRYGRPFTVAFVDLDNFKSVNDQYGHPVGDDLLKSIVSSLAKAIRRTDSVARMGGDEFALLLPETGFEASRLIMEKIRERLLEEVRGKGLPVTCSIGAVTCDEAPPSPQELLGLADRLMYSVKSSGKDGIVHRVWAAPTPPAPAGA